MDQTLITVLRYSITYYQKDLFISTQYANKHKATALHKAYWLPYYRLRHTTVHLEDTRIVCNDNGEWAEFLCKKEQTDCLQ